MIQSQPAKIGKNDTKSSIIPGKPPFQVETIEINTNTWLPYLHKTNSFDKLLNMGELKESYGNTSHREVTTTMKPATDRKSKDHSNSITYPTKHESLSQVPKRFSQFIVDQKTPYLGQGLDNLSIESPYSSDMDFIRMNKKQSSNGPTVDDSLGSQATIFSTRRDQELKAMKRNQSSKSDKNNNTTIKSKKLRRKKLKKSRKFNLQRKNAIKEKKGSIWYRLRLRMRSLVNKFKFKFTASSKRSASNTNVSRKLTRKYRENPRNPSVQRVLKVKMISAPANNPQLGMHPAVRVPSIDDALLADIQIQKTGKDRQLSNYIDQQQDDYLRNDSGNSDTVQIRELSDKANTSILPEPEIKPLVVNSREHSPHLYMVDLWRSYLSQSLAKRIQLRQEITDFLTFVANKESSDFAFDNHDEDSIRSATPDLQVKPSPDIISLHSSVDSETVVSFVDDNAEDFKGQLNRRSMLGEMLEYYSDDDSSLISNSSINSPSRDGSIQNSEYKMSRYGTVKRNPPQSNLASSITRSDAIAYKLTEMAV